MARVRGRCASAVGSLITGLQTMPSIAWFPLAILLFKLERGRDPLRRRASAPPRRSPTACITGIDNIPPLLAAGRAGARRRAGSAAYRHVVAARPRCPSFVGGLKQGWAFAWRSLLAGELLVIIANKPSIGSRLEFDRQFGDYPGMIATMIVILIIGIVIDTLVFTKLDRAVLRRRGLAPVGR